MFFFFSLSILFYFSPFRSYFDRLRSHTFIYVYIYIFSGFCLPATWLIPIISRLRESALDHETLRSFSVGFVSFVKRDWRENVSYVYIYIFVCISRESHANATQSLHSQMQGRSKRDDNNSDFRRYYKYHCFANEYSSTFEKKPWMQTWCKQYPLLSRLKTQCLSKWNSLTEIKKYRKIFIPRFGFFNVKKNSL